MTRGRNDDSRSDSTLWLRRPASAIAATQMRRRLSAWAGALGVPADLRDTMELACYEALANAASHAYRGRPPGMMELDARYDDTPPEAPLMAITVVDHGRWRTPDADPDDSHGRGLPMIRSLAGAADIAGGDTGTTVRMWWDLSLESAIAS